jgi:ferrous iron transport protein A
MSREPFSSVITLDRAETGRCYQIVSVRDEHTERRERLIEIGFLPGEPAAVIARGQPGNEPLAVRIGLSTFALRRVEAASVLVSAVDA